MPQIKQEAALLPVTVIGGYLGAGKTTLVNTLLRHANGKRLAVLVNDFGDISIDAELIESSDDQVINLAGGCVCCSIGSDLVTTLTELKSRFNTIDQVLLETSGVAMPGVVAATVSLAPGVRRDSVVVVCDSLHGPRWLADPYIADTLERQITAADCLIISKQALVKSNQTESFSDQLARLAPSTPQLSADQEHLAAVLLGQLETLAPTRPVTRSHTQSSLPQGRLQPRPAQTERDRRALLSLHFVCRQPTDLTELQKTLANPEYGVFRAKGILPSPGNQPYLLQCVAGQSVLSPWTAQTRHLGHLIVIAAVSGDQQKKLETLLRNLGFSTGGGALALNQTQKTGKIQP